MNDNLNTEGREANAAQPLGRRDGLVSEKATEKTATEKTAAEERRSIEPAEREPGEPKARDSVAGINPKAD